MQIIGSTRKRASQQGALFVCLLLYVVFAFQPAAAQTCAATKFDETAEVAKVVDGDTLHLRDGRKLRFIGINTPERAKENTAAEPFAEQARDALVAMLKPTMKVGLVYDAEKRDRYRRLLAHVYLPNGDSIEAHLLEAGLAAHIVVPPNTANWKCYRAVEQRARQAGKNVWSEFYRPIPVAQLPRDTRGFRFVTGRVSRVGNSKKSVWLNFSGSTGAGPTGSNPREVFAARIARKDLANFVEWQPQSLQGKTLVLRGWVSQYKKQTVMRIRHPASIDILP